MTYRESRLLYDPDQVGDYDKQRVATIVSHELLHNVSSLLLDHDTHYKSFTSCWFGSSGISFWRHCYDLRWFICSSSHLECKKFCHLKLFMLITLKPIFFKCFASINAIYGVYSFQQWLALIVCQSAIVMHLQIALDTQSDVYHPFYDFYFSTVQIVYLVPKKKINKKKEKKPIKHLFWRGSLSHFDPAKINNQEN